MDPSENLFLNISQRIPQEILNWENTPLPLKRFILLHVFKVTSQYYVSSLKFNKNVLIKVLSKNMGCIVSSQIELYVETLIYNGYLIETADDDIMLSQKVLIDLDNINKILKSMECKNKNG